MKLLLFTATLLFTFSSAIAQPPPAAPPGGAPVRQYQAPSVAGLKTEDHFSSLEGRFTIALPKQISGFSGLTKEEIGYEGSGGQFTWRLKEGGAIVRYTHYYDPSISFETDKDITGFQNGFRDGFLSSPGMVLKSEKRGKLGEHDELTLLAARADGAEIHVHSIVVGRTHYALIYLPSSAAGQMLLQAAVKSFKVLSQEAVDAELQKRIEAATPKPLPQTPVLARNTTDAQDDRLKGKVRMVTEFDEDLSGTWGTQGRKYASKVEYDEKGNYLRRTSFDSQGIPSDITVYGYIDKKRVSLSGYIENESGPPPMVIHEAAPAEPGKRAVHDPRFDYEYRFKHDKDRLTEMSMFLSSGEYYMRYAYGRTGNVVEELVYDKDGELNQKYREVLDERGNVIERTSYELFPESEFATGDETLKFSYDSFDAQGNWTKRTASQLFVTDRKTTYKPWYVEYRTITYYQ